MIAKISATENLGGALGYNFKKVEKGEASILLAHGLYQNKEEHYTMAEVFADMQALIPENCRTKKTVFHCSLNPHPDEKLSDERLTQIAKEYMEALGYGKQPYIVFKHNDIAREHIHIVSLRVDSEGKKINDKFEKRRSKQITDTLERKYNLIPSSKVSNKEEVETPKVDISKENIKEQVASALRMVLKHYKFCSLGELNAILSQYHLAVEEVKTEFRGKKYEGLVYVPTDDKGDKVSSPIHASDIGRGVGYTAVQNRMQKSKQAIKPLISIIRYRVLQTMRTSPKTEEELRQRLEERACVCLSERTKAVVSMALPLLTMSRVLHSMAHAWVKDIPPMYLMRIYLILRTTHSWTKRCMAVRLPVWNNQQLSSLYNPMQKKGITLLMNLLRIWWGTLSYLRAMMIGRKQLGSVNSVDKVRLILDERKDR